MSSHYNRKTPLTKRELLRNAIAMIGPAHKDMKYDTCGSILNDLECSVIYAKKTHQAPLVDETMMDSVENLYNTIKQIYDTQKFYCVNARMSVAANKKFAKENGCKK